MRHHKQEVSEQLSPLLKGFTPPPWCSWGLQSSGMLHSTRG